MADVHYKEFKQCRQVKKKTTNLLKPTTQKKPVSITAGDDVVYCSHVVRGM